jgi:Zn-dependent alcohol dehydrogenase
VEAVGDDVITPAVGTQVMAYFYLVCGYCEACQSGHDSLCRNLAAWGHHGSKSALWRHREGKGIANLQTRKSLMGHS